MIFGRSRRRISLLRTDGFESSLFDYQLIAVPVVPNGNRTNRSAGGTATRAAIEGCTGSGDRPAFSAADPVGPGSRRALGIKTSNANSIRTGGVDSLRSGSPADLCPGVVPGALPSHTRALESVSNARAGLRIQNGNSISATCAELLGTCQYPEMGSQETNHLRSATRPADGDPPAGRNDRDSRQQTGQSLNHPTGECQPLCGSTFSTSADPNLGPSVLPAFGSYFA